MVHQQESGQISRRTLLTCVSIAIIAAATIYIIFWFTGTVGSSAPTYDWQCGKCEYRFRHTVRNAAADVPIIECPECGETTAERIVHFQCRKCWEKFDMRGSVTTNLANLVCPHCGNTALRNLDHPIPGDDQPVRDAIPPPRRKRQ
jgi:putative FmdB family regulatory protein